MTLGEKLGEVINWVSNSLTGGDYEDEPGDIFGGEDDGYTVERNVVRKPATDYSTQVTRTHETNVVKGPGYKGHEVRIIEPRSFGDTTQIVKQLLDQKTVVLNLHLLDKEQSQRTIDFVCGAAFALGGSPQKVGDTVFVFTPNSVQLSVEAKETNAFNTESLWGGNL